MMLPALFGIPSRQLAHAIYGAIRTRALVILRQRVKPVWDDPLHERCSRKDYHGECDSGRIWVLAANQRPDLVRSVLAAVGGLPPAARPHIVVVACDPSVREEFADRAQEWRAIFSAGFEMWLPEEPPAPQHLRAFCRRLARRGQVLLSPAEALFENETWFADAFANLCPTGTDTVLFSTGNVNLNEADRVPVEAWRRHIGKEPQFTHATATSSVATDPPPNLWAPITTERLPALSSHARGLGVQAWLYRHKETILTSAARIFLLVGLPRHRSYVEVTDCFFIPDAGLFLSGFTVDPFRFISRITIAHTQNATELDLSEFWSRVPHPTIDRLFTQFHLPEPPRGFVALISVDALGAASRPTAVNLYEYRGRRRRHLEVPVQSLSPGTASLRTLLTAFRPDKIHLRQFMARQAARPVQALWTLRSLGGIAPERGFTYKTYRIGDKSPPAVVSIVVPIYGRWDFMRYQMESFRTDRSLRQAEWIYVLDDPRISPEIVASADALYQVYGVPFTVVSPGVNLGFSGACNLGARIARGDLLLLMNSDVFPRREGWLQPMITALAPNVGAIGARLLYEDSAVQHAGMAVAPYGPWQDLQIITHPGKGLPDRLLPDDKNVVEDGASAACLLLRRKDYAQIGGLSPSFAIGDFEDGDLCARLRGIGKLALTTPQARLYHLERQSIRAIGDDRWREMLTLYNCWLFNARRQSSPDDSAPNASRTKA